MKRIKTLCNVLIGLRYSIVSHAPSALTIPRHVISLLVASRRLVVIVLHKRISVCKGLTKEAL